MNPFNPDKKQPSKQTSKQTSKQPSKQPKKKKPFKSVSGASSSTSNILTTGGTHIHKPVHQIDLEEITQKPKDSSSSEIGDRKASWSTTNIPPEAIGELRELILSEELNERLVKLSYQIDTIEFKLPDPESVDLESDLGEGQYETVESTNPEPVKLPSDVVQPMPVALSPTMSKLISQFNAQCLTDPSATSTEKVDVLTLEDTISECKLNLSSSQIIDIFKPLEMPSFVDCPAKKSSNSESKLDRKTTNVKSMPCTITNTRDIERDILMDVSDDIKERSTKYLSNLDFKPDRKTTNVMPCTTKNTSGIERDILMDVSNDMKERSTKYSSNSDLKPDGKTTNVKLMPCTTKKIHGIERDILMDVSDDMKERSTKYLSNLDFKPDRKTTNVMPCTTKNTSGIERDILMDVSDDMKKRSTIYSPNSDLKPDKKTTNGMPCTTKNTRGIERDILIEVSNDMKERSIRYSLNSDLRPDRKITNDMPYSTKNIPGIERDILKDVPDDLKKRLTKYSSNSDLKPDRKTTNVKSMPSSTKNTRGILMDVSDDMRERYKSLGAIPKVYAVAKSPQKKSKPDVSDGKASHSGVSGIKLPKTETQGAPSSSLPLKDTAKRSERSQLSWRESKDGQPLKAARFPRVETTRTPLNIQPIKARDYYKDIPKCLLRDRRAVMPKQVSLDLINKCSEYAFKTTKGPGKAKKTVSFDLLVTEKVDSFVKAKEMLDITSDQIVFQDVKKVPVSVNQSGETSSPEKNSTDLKKSLKRTTSSSVSDDIALDSDLGDFNHDLGEALLDSIFFGHDYDDDEDYEEDYDDYEEYKSDVDIVEALKTKHKTEVPSKYKTKSKSKDKSKRKPADRAKHKATSRPKHPSQIDASQIPQRALYSGQGGGADSPDLEFLYDDTDTHGNEIAELYSYTEQPELQLNVKAFEDQMEYYNLPPSWQRLPVEKRKSVIMKLLDQLEVSRKPLRMRSARCLLYIAQGCWAEMQSDTEQQHWARINCMLLYQLGTFSSFIDLLNIEIENSTAAHVAMRKIAVSLADSQDLRVILSVLYTITEVIRNERASDNSEFQSDIESFCFDIELWSSGLISCQALFVAGNSTGDEILVIKLLGMVTRFCSGASPHFPMKKVLLLLWKLILVALGGMDTLKELKAEKRQKANLIPLDEDTMEIAKTMRSSSPPASASDLLEAQNQKRNTRPFRRSLMKQSSLDDQESLGMEMETTMGNDNGDDLADMTEYDERRPSDNSEASQMYNTHNINMYNRQMSPPPQHDVAPRGLPWKPKVRQKDIDLFLDGARQKFLGYSLPGDQETIFGLPEPIHEGVRILKDHVYTSLAELQVLKEEEMARNPLSTEEDEVELTPAEMLYQAMLPNLPQYMIALLKILLAAAPTSKAKTDSINIMADVLPEEMPMTVLQSMKLGIDVNRHKEIIVKAVSAVLLLLLKHFKLSHVYQFEFMSQHLVFANCIPLVLKFFNQNIMAYVGAKNVIPILDFPSCVIGDQPELTAESLEIGDAASFSWRNMFSCINLLRILNKLTKWKHSRIMMLVVFKSAPILKRTLKVRHAMTQLYVLKLLKMQTKYLGRQWRKSNMKTISAIYQKVRHRLNDDWAYGNDLDARPWDFQAEECALRACVDRFNNRRYTMVNENDFEPVDNDASSVLGEPHDLSENFKIHYLLWLEQEVFGTPIDWDKLLFGEDNDGDDDDDNQE